MPFAFTRELLIGIVIGVLAYWLWMHFSDQVMKSNSVGAPS